MNDENKFSEAELLVAKLNSETAVIEWEELAKHFARDVVLKVSEGVNLVDAAASMVLDDKDQVAKWLDSGELTKAVDDDARDWNARKPLLWCVVAAPWVLVQEKPGTCEGEQVH